MVVALAAVACGRLSGAVTVHAARGRCSASADQYRVAVTEPGLGSRAGRVGSRVGRGRPRAPSPEVVLEHWGGDAELLELRSPVTGAVGLPAPFGRARVAAQTLRYYDLDSLEIAYPDGAELSAGRTEVVLHGPRRGLLRRRDRLLRISVEELL